MKVLILATGKTEEHNDSYGARLIEQGKAAPTPPVAEEVGAGFSGTARWEAAPVAEEVGTPFPKRKTSPAGGKKKTRGG